MNELLAGVRWTMGQSIPFERINVGRTNTAIRAYGCRCNSLISIALEFIQPCPMCRSLFGAENEPMDLITKLIQDNARISDRSTPAFLEQCALFSSGRSRAWYISQHMRVRSAGSKCSVNK